MTVLNADGINFNAFIPLFGTERLRVPVVILTDGDAKEIGGEMSATASGLSEQAAGIPNLNVEMAEITFEHELARSEHVASAHGVCAQRTTPHHRRQRSKPSSPHLRLWRRGRGSSWTFSLRSRSQKAGLRRNSPRSWRNVISGPASYLITSATRSGIWEFSVRRQTMAAADQLRDVILAQNPTDQQREAIFAEELEFLLRAAPGSGKTWTSCRRFIWRAANWPHPVGGLALLSFTNAAIGEFKTATINVGRRDLLSDPNYVGTFDSFVERYILAPFGHLLTGADKRPKLFPGPRPGDWNNTRLKVWTDGNGGRKIPVPAWDVIPYPDGTGSSASRRHQASSEIGPVAAAYCACPQDCCHLGFYTHAQRIFWACKLPESR